jgi:hypothetical protein
MSDEYLPGPASPTPMGVLLRVVEAVEAQLRGSAGPPAQITMRDQYNVTDAGAVGPSSSAAGFSFCRAREGTEPRLADLQRELEILLGEMQKNATEPSHQIALAAIEAGTSAAAAADMPGVFEYLSHAGKWALGIASEIGTTLAAEVITKAIGLQK